MITFNQCIDYVVKNRKGNAFRGFTPEQIYATIQASAQSGAFAYVVDEATEELLGVVIGKPYLEERILHISQILTTHPRAIRELVAEFRARFPGWQLTGNRYDTLKAYGKRTNTLCNRLSKQYLTQI